MQLTHQNPNECDIPYLSVPWLLHELHSKLLEALASFFDIVHCNPGDVAKSLAWFSVSACVALNEGLGSVSWLYVNSRTPRMIDEG